MTPARDTNTPGVVITDRPFTHHHLLYIYLFYSTAITLLCLLPGWIWHPKNTVFDTSSHLRLIDSLNAVIRGEHITRSCPIGGAVDEVDENSDDFVDITDQLSGRVAFPTVVACDQPVCRLARPAFQTRSLTAVSSSGSGPLCANNVTLAPFFFLLFCRLVIRSVLTCEIQRNAKGRAEFVIARVPLSYGRVGIVHPRENACLAQLRRWLKTVRTTMCKSTSK